MTIIEKSSKRKVKSIRYLVEKGEFSLSYALLKVEELNDAGKLTEDDYEELASYLEFLIEQEEQKQTIEEEIQEEVEEPYYDM